MYTRKAKKNRFLGTNRAPEIDAVARDDIDDRRGKRQQEEATDLQSKHDSTHVERFTSRAALSLLPSAACEIPGTHPTFAIARTCF